MPIAAGYQSYGRSKKWWELNYPNYDAIMGQIYLYTLPNFYDENVYNVLHIWDRNNNKDSECCIVMTKFDVETCLFQFYDAKLAPEPYFAHVFSHPNHQHQIAIDVHNTTQIHFGVGDLDTQETLLSKYRPIGNFNYNKVDFALEAVVADLTETTPWTALRGIAIRERGHSFKYADEEDFSWTENEREGVINGHLENFNTHKFWQRKVKI